VKSLKPSCHPENIVTVRWLEIEAFGNNVWRALAQMLDQTELSRAERFHFEHDRQSYIAAHALTRAMLSSHASIAPSAWRFAAGSHGKPEIEGAEVHLQFNLSHTRGLVAVAVTRQHDVGIDVEQIDPKRLGLDVADRFFAPVEALHLRSLPKEEQPEASYAYWTLKEAYIKAIGLGLSCPLDAFNFVLEPLSICFSERIIDDPAHWFFRRLRPLESHALALAVRHKMPEQMVMDARPVQIEELLS
jgi:4'-phosphopantetheinyl transferase